MESAWVVMGLICTIGGALAGYIVGYRRGERQAEVERQSWMNLFRGGGK